ncbi:ATP-binding cassette domain-containing protein [Lactococcus paracarnosus]|uniref:ATP-binding cassette domain-containing protein n=1 Tax=Pseudolactococcus paracarnosus TaxID=2749962 RepID=A0ABT0ALV6_9LACT|nr:ATP-binding cassette domain-containing protein [Lactococcus paracarnosus]MCJ1983682.1 ATP-binding cassette domain-containing protein [Lactococcus paracarnosus]MCJ1998370.1 ATP-binding cassette domain-containing protein [Lactococcus paracarnosus]
MIELKNVSKQYGKHQLFDQLNLTFEAGKSYALIGESGSGKSTLLNLIARLEKPSSGQLLLAGDSLWHIREKRYFKTYLGYIFQNYALVDDETVAQNLSMVKHNKASQIAVLEKVGLAPSLLSSKIYQLSGGQAQRVAIARLLLKEAKIILADEPTGALDEATGQDIIALLLSLVSKDTLVIFATHDPAVYQQVDQVIDIVALKEKKYV